MKSFALGVATVALVALATPAFAAIVTINPSRVTYLGGPSVLPANLTPGPLPTGNPQANVYDFDGIEPATGPGTGFTAGSGLRSGNTGDAARPAFNSSGNFATVIANGSYTLNLLAPVQVFSFVLGSLDEGNSLTFTYSNGNTTTLTGRQITVGGVGGTNVGQNGSQNATQTNGRVIYDLGGNTALYGAGIVSAVFRSTVNSFEFDQIATAAPEPGTWGMMILGFGLAGTALRTRRRAKGLATA